MRNVESTVFIAITAIMISLPGLLTNIKPDQKSEMDNRMLQEFPKVLTFEFPQEVEAYLEDRIGFRENMITLYQNLSDIAFNKLEHPFYMYGKEGYVMTNWDLVTYQHLDVDQNYITNLGAYLKSLQNFCKDEGSEFLFFLSPNKETIYPEYFPDGYNVKNQPNRSDLLIDELTEEGVSFVYPRELFVELKDKEQLYNKKFDAGHWNNSGCYYANREIIDFLNTHFPNMGLLDEEEFNIEEVTERYLLNSYFEINEKVPSYILKETVWEEKKDVFDHILLAMPEREHEYYKNMTDSSMPRILIFCDSYFGDATKFYANHSSELMLIHHRNLDYAEYYITLFQPDIVIFEVVERGLQEPTSGVDDERVLRRFERYPYQEEINDKIKILSIDVESDEFVTIHGVLTDMDDPEEEMALKAVLNQKEYYAWRDEERFCFTFRRWDLDRNAEICFYKCFDLND